MCVLPSALPCQVSTASPSVPSGSWSEKSTSVVVPPATAAAVPVFQSSAVTVPPNGMSRWVCPSMKPGISRAPETSTTSAPSRGRSTPTASIVSPGHRDVGAERALGRDDGPAGEDHVTHRRDRLARMLCEDRAEHVDDVVDVLVGEGQRGRERDDVVEPGRRVDVAAHQQPALLRGGDDPGRHGALGRRARGLVGHQLDPDQQPAPAHVADQRVVAERVAQPGEQVGADGRGALQQPLLLHQRDRLERDRAAGRVPAERVDVAQPPGVGRVGGERGEDLVAHHGRGERDVGAGDALGHRHEVGPHAGPVVAEPRARPGRSRRSPRRRSAARRGARTPP